MCYNVVNAVECYTVDIGNNIVYIAEKCLIIETWKSDCLDLDYTVRTRLVSQEWQNMYCQKHLSLHIPSWLWRAEWDSWCLTSEARRIAALPHGHEPTVEAAECTQPVPQDRGSDTS